MRKELQDDRYRKPVFDGYPKGHARIHAHKPDDVVNLCNDHGLGFFPDRMATFASGAAHA